MDVKVDRGDAVVNSSVDTLSACINDVRCTCVYITTKK